MRPWTFALASAALLAPVFGQPVSATRGLGQSSPPSASYFDQFRQENADRSSYLSEYDSIMSPEMAREFVQKYADRDPDGLTKTAMRRGYERGIAEARKCIAFSQQTIDGEREIGRTAGYENKVAIYQAGRNMLICRRNLARYQAESKHVQ